MLMAQDGGSEPRGVRTMRVAMIAGAVGSLIGGAVVIASVATVLSVTTPQPKQGTTQITTSAPPPRTAATAQTRPPAETTGIANPTVKTAAPAGKVATSTDNHDCVDQTWPNIESRCLKRVDDANQQPSATQTSQDESITTAGTTPAELQPGSPAVPTSPVLTQPQSVASPAAVAPVAEAPAKTATSTATSPKPARKVERPRHPSKALARQSDDEDDEPVAVVSSSRSRPQSDSDDVVITERPPRGIMVRRSAEPLDDAVVARSRRPLSPLGFLGALFGSDND